MASAHFQRLFGRAYAGRKVFLTGHTGFKGSWLSLWLGELGAEVHAYSLPPPTEPNHLAIAKPALAADIRGDVRDRRALAAALAAAAPEIVFHMAAQPLVRESYKTPVETFETNVMGTANLLDACRGVPSVKAVVVVTTDKCYDNREWVWGYRESDPLGGRDPYSASKGCAEIATAAFRDSFFNPKDHGTRHGTLVASARAGNVIGGGDWAAAARTTVIRSPDATRPWQHVLEPLSGYLTLGWRLLEGDARFADAWNFGPGDDMVLTVGQVAGMLAAEWPAIRWEARPDPANPHEATLLKLDCSKARAVLAWRPVWDARETFKRTAEWYRRFHASGAEAAAEATRADLNAYVADAARAALPWAA